MSISERATASIRPMRIDPSNRDHLREQWRVAAKEWIRAEDNASRLEEGRKILLDSMTLNLIETGETAAKAERLARTSEQFRTYLRKMHDARRAANDLRIEMQHADRLYWDANNTEANERAERRLSR